MLPPGAPVAVDASIPTTVFLTYSSVAAGFPSPADDYATKATDLNAALIKNRQATFLMRVSGSSMADAGIDDGDIVLVDRALRPQHGSIIIAVVDCEVTCKRLYKRSAVIKLQAANATYPDIVPKDGQTIKPRGVVTKVMSPSSADRPVRDAGVNAPVNDLLGRLQPPLGPEGGRLRIA